MEDWLASPRVNRIPWRFSPGGQRKRGCAVQVLSGVDAGTCGFRLEATSTRRTVQDGRDQLPYRNRSCGRPRHCAAPPRYARDVALESERSLHVPLRDEMLSPARSQWPPSASALLSCPGVWATGVPPVSPDGCRNGRSPRTLPR